MGYFVYLHLWPAEGSDELMFSSLCQRIIERTPDGTLATNHEEPPRRGPGRNKGRIGSYELELSPAEAVEVALERGLIGPRPPPKPSRASFWRYGSLHFGALYQTEIGRRIGLWTHLCARRPYTGFDYYGPLHVYLRGYALSPERAQSRRKASREDFEEADALTMRDWVELLKRCAGEGVRHIFGGFDDWPPPHNCCAVFHADPLDFVRDLERIHQQQREGYPMAVLLAQEDGPYTPSPYIKPHFYPPEPPGAAFVEGLQPNQLARLRTQAAAKGEAWLRDCLCAVGADLCHPLPGGGILWAVLPTAPLYPLYQDLHELLSEELA